MIDCAHFCLGFQSGVDARVASDPDALCAGMKIGDDQLNGSMFGKHMEGHAGNDTNFGIGGDDWLNSGTGVNRSYGGAGLNGISGIDLPTFCDVSTAEHEVNVNRVLATNQVINNG